MQIRQWPLSELRHAFGLDDYPVDGRLSGEFHVYDRYQQPQGFGRMTIAPMQAYGESFETASAGLRFEGNGVRLDGIDARKSGGTITGAAFVGVGRHVLVRRGRPDDSRREPRRVRVPAGAALRRASIFSASGNGTFAAPRYEVRGRIDDLVPAR